ncbi:MAG: DUF385 domain-containing protein [Streptosporangiales bacterium]|nr:DUF385 domain-containing protein [Streptosporangiales bacterium]
MRGVTTDETVAVTHTYPPRAFLAVANPIVRALATSPLHRLVKDYMVLHVTGRKTGKDYAVPVAGHEIDDTLTVLTSAGWRRNLRDNPTIEVTRKGLRGPMQATLVEDADEVAQGVAKKVEELGVRGAKQIRVTINVDRTPTMDEYREAARRDGMALVRLTPHT